MTQEMRFLLHDQFLSHDNIAVPSVYTSMSLSSELLEKAESITDDTKRKEFISNYKYEMNRPLNPVNRSWNHDDRVRIWNVIMKTYLDTGLISHAFGMLLLPAGYYDAYWRLCRMMEQDQCLTSSISASYLETHLTNDNHEWLYSPERIAWTVFVWDQVERKCIMSVHAENRDYHYDNDMDLSLIPSQLLDPAVDDETAFAIVKTYKADDHVQQNDNSVRNDADADEENDWECPRLTELLNEEGITEADMPHLVRVSYEILDDGRPVPDTETFAADSIRDLHEKFWDFCQSIGQDSYICTEARLVNNTGRIVTPASPVY